LEQNSLFNGTGNFCEGTGNFYARTGNLNLVMQIFRRMFLGGAPGEFELLWAICTTLIQINAADF
jgi:hypothetical protein